MLAAGALFAALAVGEAPAQTLPPQNLLAQSGSGDSQAEIYRLLELFGNIFEQVRTSYVEEVEDKDLIEAAIRGMIADLDPHSAYLDAKAFGNMRIQTTGEFGGLGIEVTMENSYVKVISPIDDTPAFRAGIQAGDIITHLDGDHILGFTLQQAVERMRGPVDTNIVLTVTRGEEVLEVEITRKKITIQSARSRVEGNVGYIRITNFNEKTTSGLQKTFDKTRNALGEAAIGYVLDLRNNPGGLLGEAVMTADAFLDRGEIVSTRGRDSEGARRFHASPGDLAEGKPLVVLINGGSASASEIVAGALQDHRRAIIMGTQSFGKGSVQTVIPLGPKSAIKLTTQRYYTPSGNSIQATGISPDIIVEQAQVEPLAQNRRRQESDLKGALKNTQKPRLDAPGDDQGVNKTAPEAGKAPASDQRPVDFQLQRALDLLRGIALYQNPDGRPVDGAAAGKTGVKPRS